MLDWAGFELGECWGGWVGCSIGEGRENREER